MKLSIENKTYAIYFRHNLDAVGFRNKHPYKGKTICGIVSLVDGERIPCAEGRAYCSNKDQYCKDKGRKEALRRALKNFTYQERAYFWQFYLHRKDASETVRNYVESTRQKQKAGHS